MKKQTPIPFSTEMVAAVILGNKTITRRTRGLEKINENPDAWKIGFLGDHYTNNKGESQPNSWALFMDKKDAHKNERITVKCSQGQPGTVMWVREEHKVWREDKYWHCEYKDGTIIKYFYKSLSINTNRNLQKRKTLGKWQRARFMPKDLCRIWLEITDIKAERLQSISESDAIQEGIEQCEHDHVNNLPTYRLYGWQNAVTIDGPIQSFKSLWQHINGSESWDINPWVWIIKFKVSSTAGKQLAIPC